MIFGLLKKHLTLYYLLAKQLMYMIFSLDR